MNRHTHRRSALLALPLVVVFLLSALAARATPPTSVLLDDSTFVFAPGFDHTAIQAFLDQQPGRLGTYQATLNGKPASVAQIIAAASLGEPNQINPKVLLTLLEVTAGLLSTHDPVPATIQQPFKVTNQPTVTFESDLFAMGDILRRSFAAYDPTTAPYIRLGNGSTYQRPPFPNAGTYALEVALGHLAPDSTTFERFVGDGDGSFRATFLQFFGNPSSSVVLQGTLQATAPFLFKPFVGSFAAGSFLDHDTRSNVFVRFDGTSNGGYDGHEGTDYPMAPGKTVIAAADGVVDLVDIDLNEPNVGITWCFGYPYTPVTAMVIKHTINGVQYNTYYWHLTSKAIGINPRTNQQFKKGDVILRGETVGLSGNTGCSTGGHLHFGVQRSGKSTDPYGWCGSYADPYTNSSEVLWAEAMTNPKPCPIPVHTGNDYNGDGKPDLYGINRVGTGAGHKTEVYIMDGATQYTSYLLNVETILGDTGVDNRWGFALGDYNGDGKPDLYGINRVGTGAGHKTEVYIMDGATQYTSYLLNVETILGDTGVDNRWGFALGDYNGDGKPDLYGINRVGTSSAHTTEVYIMDGATQYSSYLLTAGTILGDTGVDNRWQFALGDYNGDGKPDLYGINRVGTSSAHTTEVYIMDGATQYSSYLLTAGTILGDTGLDNRWQFMISDYNGDGKPDLYGINRVGTSSAHTTEAYIMDGATQYSSYLLTVGTILGDTGLDCRWDFTAGGQCSSGVPTSLTPTSMTPLPTPSTTVTPSPTSMTPTPTPSTTVTPSSTSITPSPTPSTTVTSSPTSITPSPTPVTSRSSVYLPMIQR